MRLEAEAESNGEMRGASVGASEPTANDWSIGSYLLLFVGFALLSFAVYWRRRRRKYQEWEKEEGMDHSEESTWG